MDLNTLESNNLFNYSEYVTGTAAMNSLRFSRHTFEKCVEKGVITKHDISGKKMYDKQEIAQFMQSDEYQRIFDGTVDTRNNLNDLTGKEWLPETKSYFFQKGLGKDHPDAQIERQHPAPFSFQDIEKLVLFFTKRNMQVLDPFGGVGSTAKACELTGRICTSIELSEKYHNLSILRLEKEVGQSTSANHKFINGDSREILKSMPSNSIDFVVTSPPYWGILHKQDQKVKKQRVENNLDTVYSTNVNDLGNIADYNDFLDVLSNDILLQCGRILKRGKYMAIIVSDFRDKSNFISFHSDLVAKLNKYKIEGDAILSLQGIKILIQNHKSVHPYGYPFSYVENIHHQYVLIFQKK